MAKDYLDNRAKPDYKISLLTIGLSLFGLIMIASASVVVAYDNFKGANDYYYVWHQAIALLIGVVAMIFFSNIDYKGYKKIALWIIAVAVLFLIIVFIPQIGVESKGAHRWINLGIVPFQPSEFAKVAFLIYLCTWLEARKEDLRRVEKSFLPLLLMLGAISALIILEPDLGSLTVLILSSMVVFFAAGAPLWNFYSLGIFLAAVFAIFIRTSPYRWSRFLTFLNPAAESLGRSYHINQAFIAVGTGGLWGLGFGNSLQKLKYLPEPHTDSIFAIIAEELGFLRATLVIVAFVYLFFLGLRVAKKAPDTFGRLLAIGIVSSLVIQAFVNIAAMLGLVPLTGVTLPFISYGGSSLVISFIQIGILLNISRHANSQIA